MDFALCLWSSRQVSLGFHVKLQQVPFLPCFFGCSLAGFFGHGIPRFYCSPWRIQQVSRLNHVFFPENPSVFWGLGVLRRQRPWLLLGTPWCAGARRYLFADWKIIEIVGGYLGIYHIYISYKPTDMSWSIFKSDQRYNSQKHSVIKIVWVYSG